MEKVSSEASSIVIRFVMSSQILTLFRNKIGIQQSKTQSTMQWIGTVPLTMKGFTNYYKKLTEKLQLKLL
jgi:hypothetical protein